MLGGGRHVRAAWVSSLGLSTLPSRGACCVLGSLASSSRHYKQKTDVFQCPEICPFIDFPLLGKHGPWSGLLVGAGDAFEPF